MIIGEVVITSGLLVLVVLVLLVVYLVRKI